MTPRRTVPQHLTTAQAATRLGVSDDTVRALIGSGALRAVNIATRPGDVRWRVPEDALAEFLARRERPTRRGA